jgi:hypothetical protein
MTGLGKTLRNPFTIRLWSLTLEISSLNPGSYFLFWAASLLPLGSTLIFVLNKVDGKIDVAICA